MIRIHTQVINPAPVPIKTSHRGTYNLIFQQSNQKELWLDLSLGANIAGGVVVRLGIREDFFPEFDDIILICFAEWANSDVQ